MIVIKMVINWLTLNNDPCKTFPDPEPIVTGKWEKKTNNSID